MLDTTQTAVVYTLVVDTGGIYTSSISTDTPVALYTLLDPSLIHHTQVGQFYHLQLLSHPPDYMSTDLAPFLFWSTIISTLLHNI